MSVATALQRLDVELCPFATKCSCCCRCFCPPRLPRKACQLVASLTRASSHFHFGNGRQASVAKRIRQVLKQDSTGVTVACCQLSTGFCRHLSQRLVRLLASHVIACYLISPALVFAISKQAPCCVCGIAEYQRIDSRSTPAVQAVLEAELAVIQADLVAAESSKPQGGRLLKRGSKQPAKAGKPAAGSDEEDSEATVAAANVLQQGAEGEGSDSDVTEPASLPPEGRAAGLAQVLADSDDEMEESGAQSRWLEPA